MPSITNKLAITIASKTSQQYQKQGKRVDPKGVDPPCMGVDPKGVDPPCMGADPKGVDPLCKGADPYAESLIEVLLLQAHTRLEARLVVDDLVL